METSRERRDRELSFAQVPITEVRIDEETWSKATPLRRQEWRTLIGDLVDEGLDGPHAQMTLHAHDRSVRLHFEDGTVIHLDEPLLGPHMSEYLGIIRKMVEEDMPAMRLEALDMAKKVVHDHAAKALRAHAPALGDKHEAFRRLFSLVVALCEDTTTLPAAHRHRL